MPNFNTTGRQTQEALGGAAAFLTNDQTRSTSAIAAFAELTGCPDVIADGEIHRYGHKRTRWYVLHNNANFVAGAYGDWAEDAPTRTWCSLRQNEMPPAAWRVCQNQIAEARAQRTRELARTRAEAALRAREIWAKCKKEGFVHKYLDDKQVKAYGIGWGTVDKDPACLIIPLFNPRGEMVSLQKIESDGCKRFLPGGEKKGCFFKIAGNHNIFICEGYATGATIHAATGATVIVAFDAGNIPAVAKHFPKAVVACDNDRYKPEAGNAGVEAGKKSGLKYIVPRFKNGSTRPTDFNDLAALEGLRAVCKQLLPQEKTVEVLFSADIDDMHFEDCPIIKGVLDEEENLLIVGASGVGKSHFGMEMAYRLGMEETPRGGVNALFGRYEIPKPRRSLFVQAELSAKFIQKRFRKMFDYAPELRSAQHNVGYLSVNRNAVFKGKLVKPETKAQIISAILKMKADVFFIDPLIYYHEGNENDNGLVQATFDQIIEIQQETNATPVVIHHMGKNLNGGLASIRGGSAIDCWAANTLLLFKETGDIIRLENFKSRNAENAPDLYLKRTVGLTFEPVKNPQRTKEQKQIDSVICALEALGGAAESQAQILGWLHENCAPDEFSKATLSRVLKKMHAEQLTHTEKLAKNNQTKIYLNYRQLDAV